MGYLPGVCYDPETIELLRTALNGAWDSLSDERKRTVLKSDLAERILAAAAAGERDVERLRMKALLRPSCGDQRNGADAILSAALSRHG
jgi:hypothetical protein